MLYSKHFNTLLICSIILINYGNGIRTKDKMYENLPSAGCYRRLNGTHQIGCSSERGGSTGAIHFCETDSDIDFILKNATAPPYILILSTQLFTGNLIKKLRPSRKIAGLIVYPSESQPEHFTHENQCPNPDSSLKGSCGGDKPLWNPHGTGLLYEDIPFPVFYVEQEDNLKFARECFMKHNNHSFNTQRDRSLCSLELQAFMFATRNTEICMRRSQSVLNVNPARFCDPLGDQNVWSSLFPLTTGENFTEPIKGFKYIIVATHIDTTSMFKLTAGAISPITGLVALLSTAQILKKMLPNYKEENRNILFVIFNGETYDYIGSSRLLYDMSRDEFPVKDTILQKIKPQDIQLFIELNQLNQTGEIIGHSVNIPKEFSLNLAKYSAQENLSFATSETMPPGSYHTFLKNNSALPGLIITDHKDSFRNNYYNSIYDNATNLNYEYQNLTDDSDLRNDSIQNYIGKVSLVLAKSLYQEISGKSYTGDVKPDFQMVDELFHCYLENASCRVHQAVQKMKFAEIPMALYVGVERELNFITTLVGLTLSWLTGDVVGDANINCTNDIEPRNYAITYHNFSKSLNDLKTNKCYRATMNFTDAVSPAFIIDGYNWTSGEFSTWSESTWGELNVRLFLKPSAAHENMTIAIGSIVLIFSFLLVYFIKSRSDVLFAAPLPTLAPTRC